MKSKIFFFSILIAGFLVSNPLLAKEEMRDLPAFTKIALKISGKIYLEQGDTQSVKIVAGDETLEEIITEVKDRTLNIRFPSTNMFKKWDPGKIEIFITVPGIDALNVSGSGDIISDELNSRILDLFVSGSGNIEIEKLNSEQVNATVSGSGNVKINSGGVAKELKARISGSGNVDAAGFEATNVDVQASGSGSCSIISNGAIKARIAGSGNVYYSGNPSIDSSVAGSGSVKKR
ncbi:MAG TPA: head GIN domain-containing protein [Draconibacterium sp.]|nr:head GIN domain-containing protein [Draconibacterium sp.]